MFQAKSFVSLSLWLAFSVFSIAIADDDANATTTNDAIYQTTACNVADQVTFARIKFPDCVVVGNETVIVTHVITDEQTASYPGEFSLNVVGDWGDGTSPVTQVKQGFVGGQNHTTEWSHTYVQAGSYKLNFTFTTRQQPDGPDLDCLSLSQSDGRIVTIDADNSGPEACVAPPTSSSSSSSSSSQSNVPTAAILLLQGFGVIVTSVALSVVL